MFTFGSESMNGPVLRGNINCTCSLINGNTSGAIILTPDEMCFVIKTGSLFF